MATVPRLFRVIRRAIEEGVARLDVTYGRHGVPRTIYIDHKVFIADEEAGYEVRGFRTITRASSSR